MITLYRPANYNNPRASEFTGRSIDIKPFDVENGAIYHELDTGRTYRFDKENSKWYETEGGTEPTPSIAVEPITITENGTTTAPDGKAYSPVTVNVPPVGVTEPFIEEDYFFNDNGKLASLNTAKLYGYKEIREYMYYNAFACSQIVLPNTITVIGRDAFSGCEVLQLTSLPASLQLIADNAFFNCEKITISEIPETVTFIGGGAFGNCKALTEITFKGTPTLEIKDGAFQYCTSLAIINVPWAEGAVANAPWGATNATINYNYTGE